MFAVVEALVARIARPASLAIWHRGRSHRRPNRNESPDRSYFASLDLKKHADFSHRRPTSQDFRSEFSADFFFESLANWGCAIRIASHIARFGPLRLRPIPAMRPVLVLLHFPLFYRHFGCFGVLEPYSPLVLFNPKSGPL